jgi:uncharacterized protein (DUF1800 family)
MNTSQIQHLLNRAGFGENPEKIQSYIGMSSSKVVRQLLKDAENIEALKIETVFQDPESRREMTRSMAQKTELPQEVAAKILKDGRQKIADLNVQWIGQMVRSKAVLREKMTLFWHGHFACRSLVAYFTQNLHNTIRTHALGKFGDLLMAVSKEPAMLRFLNNQQNRKASPNENFAREVMELFTMGRGNYTETDIKEAARAFTGWGIGLDGQFMFRQHQHDEGLKIIFGKTGNFTGEDVIKMILARPETAVFICRKVYTFFVNENPNEQIINQLAQRFRKTDYDIADLMERVFTADWFYDKANVGTRIKSPIELLVSIHRITNLELADRKTLLFLQKILGQILFYPPTVAGWAGGRNWIDSSTLMIRMKLSENLFRNTRLEATAKIDGDPDTDFLNDRPENRPLALMNWTDFEKNFSGKTSEATVDNISAFLIQTPLKNEQKTLVLDKIKNKPEPIKEATIALMALPEYQLG